MFWALFIIRNGILLLVGSPETFSRQLRGVLGIYTLQLALGYPGIDEYLVILARMCSGLKLPYYYFIWR